MAQLSIETSEKRLEAQPLVHVFGCQWQQHEWSPTGASYDSRQPPSEQDRSFRSAWRGGEHSCVWCVLTLTFLLLVGFASFYLSAKRGGNSSCKIFWSNCSPCAPCVAWHPPVCLNELCFIGPLYWKSCLFFCSDVKVFNIVMIALALCVLTITSLYCITVCYSRTRWTSDTIEAHQTLSTDSWCDVMITSLYPEQSCIESILRFLINSELIFILIPKDWFVHQKNDFFLTS